jgi:ubiquinone/menaquinone biosynthesis C-methylase UbiE
MVNLGVQTTAIKASAGSLPLRDNVFDIVLSLDVLEHLSQPKEAVREIRRAARNSGLVALSLPHKTNFRDILEQVLSG